MNEVYVCATLVVVLATGLVTDIIGIYALFGAFVLRVLVPEDEPFAGALVEKVEDLVSGLFLPSFFVSSGLKIDEATMFYLLMFSIHLIQRIKEETDRIRDPQLFQQGLRQRVPLLGRELRAQKPQRGHEFQ
ncbi:UNVERIFIED_CONTAM: Cation/H(+) antiporter 18 [Sesamum radiatum]|uniref:Cation/H(+) antiporter 18 n=1 Tax=Sesamum radiatum TaxID=300843 RepID=A0AAW2KZU7_SESRA